MTKRIWSRVLLMLLVAALVFTTACGGNSNTNSTAAATTAAAAGGTTAAATTAAPSDEIPSITWVLCAGKKTDNDMVMEHLSQYILEKINVNVTINNMENADYKEKISVMLSTGQDIDMVTCNGSYGNPIADMVKIEAIQPVTQYKDTLLADAVAVLPENIWKDATYDNEIWGVPLYKNRVRNYDFIYNKTMAEAAGVQDQMEALKWDWAPELMEALYPIKEAVDNSGIASAPFLTQCWPATTVRVFAAMDILQGDNQKKAYASVNIDGEEAIPSQEFGKVYNLYGTEEYLEWCKLSYQWVQDGLIPADEMKNIDPDNAFKNNGELFAWTSSGLTDLDLHSVSPDFETILIRSNKAIGLANASNGVYCVPTASDNVEEACKLMNLTNSDSYLSTSMRYGIEGTHWKWGEDGQVTVGFEGSRNADASNRGYYYWYGIEWGNLFIINPAKESAAATFVEDLRALNEVGSTVSKYYGFIFDIAEVTEYVGAIDQVVAQYFDQCGNGRLPTVEDIDATFDAFNQQMEANGLAKVIEAAQAQLEAYAAANNL